MFESLETALGMIGMYAAVGFCLAVIYNVLRFFRLAFPKYRKTAAVFDFLFAVTAGLVLFAFSVPYGTGFFRLYYVAAAAFGFALNMVSVGMIVPPLARFFGRAAGWILQKLKSILAVPVRFICDKSILYGAKLTKYISKLHEKCKMHLQKHRRLLYNKNNHKIGEVHPKGGENRNAIKAKVRKIV